MFTERANTPLLIVAIVRNTTLIVIVHVLYAGHYLRYKIHSTIMMLYLKTFFRIIITTTSVIQDDSDCG